MSTATEAFASALPIAATFEAALDPEVFHPLPDDWYLAVTDVAASREAIASGRAKQINMVGAALIPATMNALGVRSIPYTFCGDGAVVALAPDEAEAMRPALGALVRWAADEHGLTLRAGLIPVSVLSASGHPVTVAAVRLSPEVVHYAFAGGGLSEADRLLKAGEHGIPAGPYNSRPDLTGLSCRWAPVRPIAERVVSLIIEPAGTGDGFPAAARRLLDALRSTTSSRGPFGDAGPQVGSPGAGILLELRNAALGLRGRTTALVSALVQNLIAWTLMKSGIKAFGFDPAAYVALTARNTDYRKMQDGLRMTLVLSRDEVARLVKLLDAEVAAGDLRYGLCVQDEAILTCYVPTVARDDHLHFLDGAGGGYSGAAADLAARCGAVAA